jgi:hypothetical protein
VLEKLVRDRHVEIRAVGAGANALRDQFPGLELREWQEEKEVAEIQAMDLGIMPLPDEPWARGKCGYKLIQYLACELPVVASPVGVNTEIVDPGVNGYLAVDDADWETALTRLLDDPDVRSRMGAAGRRRVEESYSLKTHGKRLVGLLTALAPVGAASR